MKSQIAYFILIVILLTGCARFKSLQVMNDAFSPTVNANNESFRQKDYGMLKVAAYALIRSDGKEFRVKLDLRNNTDDSLLVDFSNIEFWPVEKDTNLQIKVNSKREKSGQVYIPPQSSVDIGLVSRLHVSYHNNAWVESVLLKGIKVIDLKTGEIVEIEELEFSRITLGSSK